jgi:pentatricopeptide repeat protein
MKTQGLEIDAWTSNSLMAFYLKRFDFDKVEALFKEATIRNFKTYTLMLQAAFEKGNIKLVHDTLRELREKNVGFDHIMYTVCINGFRNIDMPDMALHYFQEMVSQGFEPSTVDYHYMMDIYCRKGEFGTAAAILDEFTEKGHKIEEITLYTFMNGYGLHRNLRKAFRLFLSIPKYGIQRTLLTYNCILSMYLKNNKPIEALKFADRIEKEFDKIDIFTATNVLQAYIMLGNEEDIIKAYQRQVELGFGSDPNIVNLLVSYYANRNQIEKSLKVAQYLFERGKTDPASHPYPHFTHTAIMSALLRNYKNDEVRKYAFMLKSIGVQNQVVLDIFLKALYYSGRHNRIIKEFWQYCQENLPDLQLYATYIWLMRRLENKDEAIRAYQHLLDNDFKPTLQIQRMMKWSHDDLPESNAPSSINVTP